MGIDHKGFFKNTLVIKVLRDSVEVWSVFILFDWILKSNSMEQRPCGTAVFLNKEKD